MSLQHYILYNGIHAIYNACLSADRMESVVKSRHERTLSKITLIPKQCTFHWSLTQQQTTKHALNNTKHTMISLEAIVSIQLTNCCYK